MRTPGSLKAAAMSRTASKACSAAAPESRGDQAIGERGSARERDRQTDGDPFALGVEGVGQMDVLAGEEDQLPGARHVPPGLRRFPRARDRGASKAEAHPVGLDELQAPLRKLELGKVDVVH